MKPDEHLDLIRKLEYNYDGESVERAVASLDSGAFDGWIISNLLSGRGATLLWPRIEQHLKQSLSLKNIARLADYLPGPEIKMLLEQVEISDIDLIQNIKGGGFPPIRILPKERQQKLYDSLVSLVKADSNSEHVPDLLKYLLDADRRRGAEVPSDARSVQLASEWCLTFKNEKRIESVLSQLLYSCPSQELISLAESHLYDFSWSLETTFLLAGLMAATRASQKRFWIDYWYEQSEPHETDGWIISQWIRTTNCSRRAQKCGKNALDFQCPGEMTLFRGMADFLHRKSVRRWINRFIKSNIDSGFVRRVFPDVIKRSPTKYYRSLAKQAMKAANDEHYGDILLALVKARDGEAIELAKQRVNKFPDAPLSFKLMCQLSKSDPAAAVPWLKDWIRTALPEQMVDGLTAIVAVSPTAEHLQMARDCLKKVQQEQLPIYTWRRARLLDALLKVNPTESTIREATDLLDKATEKTHPVLRRLARRLNNSVQFS